MSQNRHGLILGKERHKFSAAHMTVFPDGTKEPLHGHNFQVTVSLELATVQFAQFLDLGIVRQIVEILCSEWDNKLLLAAENRFFKVLRQDAQEIEFVLTGKRYIVPVDEVVLVPVDNIAVESLAVLFADRFAAEIHKRNLEVVLGIEVTITESEGQGGTCYRTLMTGQL